MYSYLYIVFLSIWSDRAIANLHTNFTYEHADSNGTYFDIMCVNELKSKVIWFNELSMSDDFLVEIFTKSFSLKSHVISFCMVSFDETVSQFISFYPRLRLLSRIQFIFMYVEELI